MQSISDFGPERFESEETYMNNGSKAVIAVLILVVAALGAYVFVSNGGMDNITHDKNSGTVVVSVTNTYLSTMPVKIYIDGELVQDTSLGPMTGGSGTKKVTWGGSEQYHSVSVKVVYGSGSSEKTQSKNVTVAKGGNQVVTIML